MGRAKLNMELIKKEKERSYAFNTRKNTVIKKVYELATLCGIKAVAIIFGHKQDTVQPCPLEPEIFPDNRDEVLELINKYKGQSLEDRKNRTSLLSDVYKNMIKNAQKELTDLRNTNLQSKYPTDVSKFDSFAENDLWRIVASLENNIKNAKAKLRQVKDDNNSNNVNFAYFRLQQQQRVLTKRSRDFEEENLTTKYRVTIDPHQAGSMRVPIPMPIQQQEFPYIDHYQMDQRMVNFGGDYVGDASNIVHNAHSSESLYNCPTMAGTVDNIAYVNNLVREPPSYYDEGGMQLPAQHLNNYHPLGPGSAPHQTDTHDQFYQDHTHDQYYQDRNW